MDPQLQKIIFLLFPVGLILLFFFMRKYGGLKGAMFGAPVKCTVGEIEGAGSRYVKFFIKVHVLDGSPERAVGLELITKPAMRFAPMPCSLSVAQARNLIALLQQAVQQA
jgi:hypothetical protein